MKANVGLMLRMCFSLLAAAGMTEQLVHAQTLPAVNGQWKSIGNLTTVLAPINSNACNARLVYSSSSDFWGKNVTRVPATRTRSFTPPTGVKLPASQILSFDLTRDELTYLSLAGGISSENLSKLDRLYQSDSAIAPTSLFVSVTLSAGAAPIARLVYPNRAAVNEGDSMPIVKLGAFRIETACFTAN